ncbi:formin-like protein 3 isoform X2 [Momordica charantia]|uniref:Formin-like protein n=1 Tax=Momordica charantia TaxID=3673 RepID=A0A6J1CH09_MOMCH|nr:formin-like protein 3 isoform X2 [Momordica charantia]
MVMQREMELRGAGYVFIFVTLLCALAIASSEGRRKTIEMVLFSADDCRLTSSELGAHMSELACMRELAEGEYKTEEFVPCVQKGNGDRAIRILPPDMKQGLLDCLRRKNVLSRSSSEERPSFNDWLIRPVEMIFGGSNIPMRHLISKSESSPPTDAAAEAPAPSPSPSPSPSPDSPADSPSPSPSDAPVSSKSDAPSPSAEAPAKAPSPKNHDPVKSPVARSPPPSNKDEDKDKDKVRSPPPSNEDKDEVRSPPPPKEDNDEVRSPPPPKEDKDKDKNENTDKDADNFDTPPAPVVRSPPSPRAPSKPHPSEEQEEQDNSETVIIAAVVATGVLVVLVVAMLLFCCRSGEKSKVEPQIGLKDERPLLNISLSEISAGTKEFSADNGNKAPCFVGNLSVNPENGTSNGEGVTSEGNPSIMPPLKPPPGRQDSQPPDAAPPPSAAAAAAAATAPPAPPPPASRAPPPPPMKVGRPPPAPPGAIPGKPQAAPLGPHKRGPSGSSMDADSGGQKTKLKPFFWDKVLANPGQSMVWHEISGGSFQFNEEMMESLFGYTAAEANRERRKDSVSDSSVQYIQIIDAKKAQNLSILLRALNVTTAEVLDALQEGNPDLPAELLQTLLKMAPTTEEELKLRLFTGDLSQLGPAERFLKVLVDIPFAFKRLECLLFMLSMAEDVTNIKESFATLEVASNKLRNSRLFLKLLEAVLKTGNRMNVGTYRGGAQAFKLDTLLKLADVKGTDGKTSLLHFVVQEIVRSEGIRAARSARESRSLSSISSADTILEDFTDDSAERYRQLGLQVVSGLSTELADVKKAAAIEPEGLTTTISKLGQSLLKAKGFINAEMKSLDEDSKFLQSVSKFLEEAEADIAWIGGEEKKIMALVKSTVDYFHGNSGKDEGLRLFTIVRDFLIVLDKTCKQVKEAAEAAAKQAKSSKKEPPTPSATSKQNSDLRKRLFPAIAERRVGEESNSSDDEEDDGESSSSSS